MSKESSSGSGIGIAGLLGVAFIVLKLCKVITWSWLWVLCPFWAWIPIVIVVLIGYGIYAIIKYYRQKNNLEKQIAARLKKYL